MEDGITDVTDIKISWQASSVFIASASPSRVPLQFQIPWVRASWGCHHRQWPSFRLCSNSSLLFFFSFSISMTAPTCLSSNNCLFKYLLRKFTRWRMCTWDGNLDRSFTKNIAGNGFPGCVGRQR